ncbi:MAG: T9SS type A sorting domain-containing protein, partial [Ignavibacteriae bacterium]|nr:T9SS type A sorting domain-containing protein [Ignavibacteriota bacterium]
DQHNSAIDDGANAGLPEIMAGNLDITNSKTVTLFESFGLSIWNKGGHGLTTNEFNDAFGKVTVFGSDSVKLSLIDEFGTLFADHTLKSEMATSVAKNNLNNDFYLEQNYPNPFNPSTTIRYSIPKDISNEFQEVKLIISDILGCEVAILVHKKQRAGSYQVEWNASTMPSGVYFYRLSFADFLETKKMILLR